MAVADDRAALTLHHRPHAGEGSVWGPAPLAEFDIYSSMEQRVERALPRVVGLKRADDAIHVTLEARQYDITVGIRLSIRDDRLVVQLPWADVKERDAGMYRLFTVRLLPGLMRVGPSGQVLLPLSSGVMFSPAGKPAVSDQFLIYGEQSRWELLPMLPVASVGEGGSALIALATGCAEEAQLTVTTDGCGHGGIDLGSSYRQNWPDPVDACDRAFALVPRQVAVDLLHESADVLRRHVVEELGKPTLRQRAEESKVVAELMSAYTMKLFFGVTNQGAGMARPGDADFGKYRLIMTCDEAVDGLRRLHQAGIERVHTQCVGWIPGGHDGYYPTHHVVDERIGGEAAFRAMLAAGQRLGYLMNVHDNYNEAYRVSPDFDPQHVAIDLYGELTQRGRWGGGQAYLEWMLTLPHERVEGAMQKVKDLGVNGPTYIDAIANPLYRNYDRNCPGPRGDHARGIVRVLKAASALHGGVGIECGFLYGVLHADSTCMPASHRNRRRIRSDWPIAALMDCSVPLYQLALSDLLIMETNAAVNWLNLMDAALMAKHPRTEWGYHPGFHGAAPLSDAMIARIVAFNDLCLKRLGRLQPQRLMRWESSGEVERTLFEDGTEVRADFGAQRLWIDGREIPCPPCMPSDAPAKESPARPSPVVVTAPEPARSTS